MKKTGTTGIGKILKPHGIKGELSVKFDPAWVNGKNFRKQKFLFAEIYPGDDLVPFFIESAEADHYGQGRIKFEDFNNSESVRELVNKQIFVPSGSFSSKTAGKSQGHELLGYSATDKKSGTIGIIEEVLENEMQQTLLIKKGIHEILVPLVEEFVVKIDKKNKNILLKIPEGLISLNG